MINPLHFFSDKDEFTKIESNIKIKDETNKQTFPSTTPIYETEPPHQKSLYVTKKSLLEYTADMTNEIRGNDVKIFDKTLSKDIEMYSGIPNLLIKLNRTREKNIIEKERFTTSTTTKTILELVRNPKSNIEEILIDPKIEDLNANFSENNESEIFIPIPTKMLSEQQENNLLKQENTLLTKSAIEEQKPTITEEPLQPIPQPHPKPNRKRQLTRQQSRSFYPYFFSRVLG